MAALSANKSYLTNFGGLRRTYPVAAAKTIYRGGYVGQDPAGYVKPFVPGDVFVGIAAEAVDNSGGAAGDLSCRVLIGGTGWDTLTGAADTDIGKPVYATSDNDLSLSGHPDAYVGRIMDAKTNLAYVQLRDPFERLADSDPGSIDMYWDFSKFWFAAVLTAGGEVYHHNLRMDAVGAGIAAGGVSVAHATGEVSMLLDNDNEAQNLTIETPQVFNIVKGITFTMVGRLKTAGGAATDDVDFGLAGLSGGLTDTERADMDAATAGLTSAKFHLDANANDIFASSDDNASPVAAVDTTIDNSLTVNKTFHIIVRPDATVETWINATRVLSATAFLTAASGLMAGFVNLEKSSNTGVPEVRVRSLRVAGALA